MNRIKNFFSDVSVEMKKVSWPKWDELKGSTWVVVSFSIIISAFLFFFSNFILIANMIKSVIRGQKAPADPWGGWSFEWMTSSPPPTPSFPLDDLPTLKDANEDHIANEPSAIVKWFQGLMVLDNEEEVSH